MKVLLTAFNPFAGRSLNAAAETLKHIKRHNISVHEFELVKVELPTEYERSREILKESLLREKPDLVIALGEAAGRNRISLERVAINLNDSKAKDNAKELENMAMLGYFLSKSNFASDINIPSKDNISYS